MQAGCAEVGQSDHFGEGVPPPGVGGGHGSPTQGQPRIAKGPILGDGSRGWTPSCRSGSCGQGVECVLRPGCLPLVRSGPGRDTGRLRADFLPCARPSPRPHRGIPGLSGRSAHPTGFFPYIALAETTPPHPGKEVASCWSQDLSSIKNLGEAQRGPAQRDSAVFWGLSQVTGRKPLSM